MSTEANATKTSSPSTDAGAVQYELSDGIATIRIDDGKRNALSPAILTSLYAALDRAEKDRAIVILTGRVGVFSAGFHLGVLRGGNPARALGMLRKGYRLPARLLSFPYPVVVACNGHCFAMGAFLLLSADHAIGTAGDFQIAVNEVAIGLPMPRVGAAMLAHRLSPAVYQRTVTVAAHSTPEQAKDAGFFDELAAPEDLEATARARAESFKALDMPAHRISKRRIRGGLIRRLRFSLPLDLFDAVLVGLRGARKGRKKNGVS
ncbi:MAG: crotonase/enoyl-CoA hydratase family protein [Pseudomonadota bacterium]